MAILHIVQFSRIYKAICCCLLSAALVLITASCQSPSDFSEYESTAENSSDNIIESIPENDPFADYVYDANDAQSFSGVRAAVSEKGYFFDVDRTLFFYDIASGSFFPLCTKASCRHSGKSCNAHVYDAYEGGDSEKANSIEDVMNGVPSEWVTNCCFDRLFYWGDHLYMLSQKWDGTEVLYQYDTDFTAQKKIGELSKPFEKPRVMAQDLGSSLVHNGWLYYLAYIYDATQADELHHMAEYNLCRIRLEENSVPEELFRFTFPVDYDAFTASWIGFRILSAGDDIYCIGAAQGRDFETEDPVQQRLIRYREADGAELLWSYTGNEKVNFFGNEGAGPVYAYASCFSNNGDLVYLTGPGQESMLICKSIAAVDLKTKESRVLYRTPYQGIEGLKTDGTYYYFIEHGGAGKMFLTAIDMKGNLIRRYQFEYSEKFINAMEQQGTPREQWPNGDLMLMLADGRYLVIRSYNNDGGFYKDLSTDRQTDPYLNTDGIGLILIDDFISGEDIEVRQIY